jgi:hypothetical protein
MGKYKSRTALRHEDDISRLNSERQKRVELEQAGVVGGTPGNRKENVRYLLAMAVCFAVIVLFSLRLLQGRAESEGGERL